MQFAVIRKYNVVIYDHGNSPSTTYYIKSTEKIVDFTYPTICILHNERHFQCLLPYNGNSIIRLADIQQLQHQPPCKKQRVNPTNSTALFHKMHSKYSSFSKQTIEKKDFNSSFMNKMEIQNIYNHLSGMSNNDLMELYDTICTKLKDQNGWVVDFNPDMTAILGCHTNSLMLGSSEQAKAAGHYLGPYVDKDKTTIGESLNVVYEAMKHAKTHPSVASDSGTDV